jgi:hypothetical protein
MKSPPSVNQTSSKMLHFSPWIVSSSTLRRVGLSFFGGALGKSESD